MIKQSLAEPLEPSTYILAYDVIVGYTIKGAQWRLTKMQRGYAMFVPLPYIIILIHFHFPLFTVYRRCFMSLVMIPY